MIAIQCPAPRWPLECDKILWWCVSYFRSKQGQTYLPTRMLEVDLWKFCNEEVLSIIGHRNVVSKGGTVIALCLVQDHVIWMHTRYSQSPSKFRWDTDHIVICIVMYAKPIRVLPSTTVHCINYFISYWEERMSAQDKKWDPGKGSCWYTASIHAAESCQV